VRIRRIYSSRLVRLMRQRGMCLYPFILFRYSREGMRALAPRYYRRPDGDLGEIPGGALLFRHEWEHVRQVRRLGWFGFYARWIWYWITPVENWLEREADATEMDAMPADCRRAFAEDFPDLVRATLEGYAGRLEKSDRER